MKVLLALFALLLASPSGPAPAVFSHSFGPFCFPTGCLGPYDGTTDYDGPSGYLIGTGRVAYTLWEEVPVGDWSYEVYFSPIWHRVAPTQWELDPSEVCGPTGSWSACMCMTTQLVLWLEVTTADGRPVSQFRRTDFMFGSDSRQLDFDPVPGAISARMLMASSHRLLFFFEHLGGGFTDYTGCAWGTAWARPVQTNP